MLSEAHNSEEEEMKLGIGSWALSKFTKKGLIHYWDYQMGNPDYVGSICRMSTRYDYLRDPKTFNVNKLKLCDNCVKLIAKRKIK